MTTDVIELSCEKLGVTIENLVPAVISYETHKCHVSLCIGIVLLLLGTLFVLIGFAIHYKCDADILFFILGVISILIGIVIVPIYLYELHMWHSYPTMCAYETVFRWIGGSA